MSRRGTHTSKAKGDWNCTHCGDFQFARNYTCRVCGADRSAGVTEGAYTLWGHCMWYYGDNLHLQLRPSREVQHFTEETLMKAAQEIPDQLSERVEQGKVKAAVSVDMSGHYFGDSMCRAVETLVTGLTPVVDQIRELKLFKNNIGDEGARQLASVLKDLRDLEKLRIDQNRIGTDGAVDLLKVLIEGRLQTQEDDRNSLLVRLDCNLLNFEEVSERITAETGKIITETEVNDRNGTKRMRYAVMHEEREIITIPSFDNPGENAKCNAEWQQEAPLEQRWVPKAWSSKTWDANSWEDCHKWWGGYKLKHEMWKMYVKELLRGTWRGQAGEKYEFHFGKRRGSDVWYCYKWMGNVCKEYEVYTDERKGHIIWGATSSYYLDVSELAVTPQFAKWYDVGVHYSVRPRFIWKHLEEWDRKHQWWQAASVETENVQRHAGQDDSEPVLETSEREPDEVCVAWLQKANAEEVVGERMSDEKAVGNQNVVKDYQQSFVFREDWESEQCSPEKEEKNEKENRLDEETAKEGEEEETTGKEIGPGQTADDKEAQVDIQAELRRAKEQWNKEIKALKGKGSPPCQRHHGQGKTPDAGSYGWKGHSELTRETEEETVPDWESNLQKLIKRQWQLQADKKKEHCRHESKSGEDVLQQHDPWMAAVSSRPEGPTAAPCEPSSSSRDPGPTLTRQRELRNRTRPRATKSASSSKQEKILSPGQGGRDIPDDSQRSMRTILWQTALVLAVIMGWFWKAVRGFDFSALTDR